MTVNQNLRISWIVVNLFVFFVLMIFYSIIKVLSHGKYNPSKKHDSYIADLIDKL